MTNKEAIKFLKEPRMWEWLNVAQQIAIDMAIDALSQEPKTGHWKEIGYHIYECSECGRVESINDFENVYIEYPYCHCGARMVESQESEEEE